MLTSVDVPVSEAVRRAIQKEAARESSPRTIAGKLGISVAQVMQHYPHPEPQTFVIPPQPQRGPRDPLIAEQAHAMRIAWLAGWTSNEIATHFQVSKQTVLKYQPWEILKLRELASTGTAPDWHELSGEVQLVILWAESLGWRVKVIASRLKLPAVAVRKYLAADYDR